MTTKKKGTLGYYKELAKEVGYPNDIEGFNIGPFIKWARENGILANPTDINSEKWKKVIENSGCKTTKEYRDKCAQIVGYKDYNDRYRDHKREWRHDTVPPLSEFNKDCSRYFGDFTENLMIKTFEDTVKMPPNNPGFDWTCKKGDKIDNKGVCLIYSKKSNWSGWEFDIRYNSIADWFILSCWDNRDSLNPLHILAFHKHDMVRKGRGGCAPRVEFWRRKTFTLTNTPECLKEFEKYEITDRLDKLKELCNELKD